ncbi:hypothetical protein NUW58_g6001 [Xylaria curta]|uniref:Uncharacterized protein n=1 Tax=Xylaria curta TaxID=42375 RepID=A0ACC1P1D5_9PEZI|nr:hypothetical protein NUW58_g6001 [Xylaria curta]
MQLKTIALASAIAAVTGAIETHGGFQYEARFSPEVAPETKTIKTSYEEAAAQQAYARLHEQIKATGVARQCLTESNSTGVARRSSAEGVTPADLYALKDCIAADDEHNFFALLADDIEESNTFWEQVVRESTSDRTQWVPARAVSSNF